MLIKATLQGVLEMEKIMIDPCTKSGIEGINGASLWVLVLGPFPKSLILGLTGLAVIVLGHISRHCA